MLVYLSLGSNLSDRFKNIQTAIKLLKKACCPVIKTSSIYETSPWGITKQPNFLNLALKGETKLSPEELLKEIKIKHKNVKIGITRVRGRLNELYIKGEIKRTKESHPRYFII